VTGATRLSRPLHDTPGQNAYGHSDEQLASRRAVSGYGTRGGTVGDKEFTCAEGFRFLVGSRYVVFAEGAPLETSACSRRELVNQAEQTLQWLSHKPHKKGA
jgi:hypothetical protein